MNSRAIVALAAALALAGTASCAPYSRQASAPAGEPVGLQPAASVARPAPAVAPPPAPRVVTLPDAEGGAEIAFNASGPAITETLEKTVDLLLEAKAENERLKLSLDAAKADAADKDRQIEDLTRQLDLASGEVTKLQEALEQWKADVLGFRDEMRKAEEAEIEVLQEILMLLKDFEKEKPPE